MSAEKFFKLLEQGENIFLTGAGGTGKSFTLREAVKMYPHNFVITSSTGISAINLHEDAKTIHSFSGINTHTNDDYKQQTSFTRFCTNLSDDVVNGILGTKKLIIDEISMISAEQLDLIDRVFKFVRMDYRPFGGIQIIFSGDFLQLPPVVKPTEENPEPQPRLAFESTAWIEACVKTVQLTEVKRTNNKDFAELLCRVRTMDYTAKDFKILKATEEKEFEQLPVKLYNSNMKVDNENSFQLSRLDGKEIKIKAKWRGDWDKVKEFKKSLLAMDELVLKPNCRVMIIVNKSQDALNDGVEYVNGSLGTFLKIETRMTTRKVWIIERDPQTFEITNRYKDNKEYHVLAIKLDSGNIVYLKRNTWKHGDEVENEHGQMQAEVEYSQFPVRLSYALTTHKAQGMSLPLVELDAHGIRTNNQLYVGISRAESLEGLKIKNLRAFNIKACPKALEFYKNGEHI